jgi:two-component system LytT family response regulator
VTLRAVIADDEPLARQRLRELLAEVPWVACVGEAETGPRAVAMIDALEPDLVFLDIEMPELDGLAVLERIAHDPVAIFTTAHDRYAVAAFELEALDYLLKPFGRDRLHAALERARRAVEGKGEERGPRPSPDAPEPASLRERVRAALGADGVLTRFFVRDRGRIVPVSVAEIERLEAADDYVTVCTRGRRYLVYLTLNDFERRLDPDRFVRIHRAHIVNLDFVKELVPFDGSRMQVELRDGTKILASRARSKELRSRTL